MPKLQIEPATLAPAELDAHLAAGWYRVGHRLITTDLLLWQGELRSTLWTRLDVRGHRFGRSLRKLMAQNGRRFEVRVGALALDEPREALYAAYRESVGGDRAPRLDDVVGGERGRALFDTREISVWSEDRLVAFSWFDVGAESVESVIGVFDPAHKKHSLGLYTLLLEIEETAALGRRFHYAGYVLAEPSGMDYKRRVGALEFFDPETASWLPAPPFAEGQSPAEILRRRIDEAERALTGAGVAVIRCQNPALEVRGLLEQVPKCPPEPIFLVCETAAPPWVLLVTWDARRGAHAVQLARAATGVVEYGPSGPRAELRIYLVEEPLAQGCSAGEAVDIVTGWLARIVMGRGSAPARAAPW
jgi:arginyl-tRNA--protein-N-Asp/Glu arginylyltransferase